MGVGPADCTRCTQTWARRDACAPCRHSSWGVAATVCSRQCRFCRFCYAYLSCMFTARAAACVPHHRSSRSFDTLWQHIVPRAPTFLAPRVSGCRRASPRCCGALYHTPTDWRLLPASSTERLLLTLPSMCVCDTHTHTNTHMQVCKHARMRARVHACMHTTVFTRPPPLHLSRPV